MHRPADPGWVPAFMRVLGDELRTQRRERGWTRHDLLNHLEEAISLQTLASYELGIRKISVCRLASICRALDVAPTSIIQSTVERTADHTDPQTGCPVDLHAASQLTQPELAPLRRWATNRLHSIWDTEPRIVRLTPAALQSLATVCGLDPRELTALLPQPPPASPDDTD